jgi:PAS domain S-box-containing protein
VHANPAAAKIFGYDSVDEIMKVSIEDLFLSENQRQKNIQILKENGFFKDKEVQLKRKDNTVFWGLISVNAVFDSNGYPVKFNGTIEDISEIKLAKSKLEEANQQILLINQNLEERIQEALKRQEDQHSLLIQKSKLESLGELSAGIAHEINQPLGVMSLSFENLKQKISANKITPEYLDSKFKSIQENIKRIRDIIDHIRTFSREQDSFVLDKVNLNKVVQKALSMIGMQYKNHNIHIKTELKENIGFTVGSNLKLEQVVLNLLSNAKYALEEKGIYVNESEFHKQIVIKTDSTKNKVILIVEDNGAGIKFSHLSKIFDPFFTTKPEGLGTGLGLSIVWGIITSMHGDIIVNSMERKYTKFRITFPRFPEND